MTKLNCWRGRKAQGKQINKSKRWIELIIKYVEKSIYQQYRLYVIPHNNIIPGIEQIQALADISRSAVCCHSNETRTPITNLPNSARLEGTSYHSSNLHPDPCSSVGMRRGTDRQTDAQTTVTNIHFASAMPHAKCNSLFFTGSTVCNAKRRYISYSEADFAVFAPHACHVAPMWVKFGMDEKVHSSVPNFAHICATMMV